MKTPTTTQEMIESLRSQTCPSCGRGKRPHATFCVQDYWALPNAMQRALYKRVGFGYEQAFTAAVEYLARKREEQRPVPARSMEPGDQA